MPPKWLKMEFMHEYKNREGDWQTSFEQACGILGKEVGRREEDLDASGKKWLEEEYGDGKQKQSRKQRWLAKMAQAEAEAEAEAEA